MKERPILFSAPMVCALLAGTKTQTRRIVKPQPDSVKNFGQLIPYRITAPPPEMPSAKMEVPISCPYGVPGDRLWVREGFHATEGFTRPVRGEGAHLFGYQVPGQDREFMVPGIGRVREFSHHLGGWGGRESRNFPSIHMPRWASRITLEVTEVRVERLHDISEADALAEGIIEDVDDRGPFVEHAFHPDASTLSDPGYVSARMAYCALWNHINGPGAWDANPWVWAVSFKILDLPRQPPATGS